MPNLREAEGTSYHSIVPERINVNGLITAAEKAAISPLDRGFLMGDSVYETLRTYAGRPFLLDPHLSRLRRSADRLGIHHQSSPVDPAVAITQTLADAGNEESAIRVVLTRGVGPIGYDPEPPGPPTLVVFVRPCPSIPSSSLREGVDVAIVSITRNAAAALDPAIKSSNLLNNLLAWQEGRRLGAFEPILLNAAGRLTEGASSNLFLARGTRLLTPPLEDGLLEGITRGFVIELARRDGVEVHEESLGPDDLRRADEAFLTSTLKGILPIRRCDGWAVGVGRPGVLTRRLLERFGEATGAAAQADTKTGSDPGSILR
jgi:branched-chain amino acid aminotransferase